MLEKLTEYDKRQKSEGRILEILSMGWPEFLVTNISATLHLLKCLEFSSEVISANCQSKLKLIRAQLSPHLNVVNSEF